MRCKYNIGVDCDEHENCTKCGFSPSGEARRKSNNYEKDIIVPAYIKTADDTIREKYEAIAIKTMTDSKGISLILKLRNPKMRIAFPAECLRGLFTDE